MFIKTAEHMGRVKNRACAASQEKASHPQVCAWVQSGKTRQEYSRQILFTAPEGILT